MRRSTANSGGTSAAVAAVPTNDIYPAATASVLQYTANPTAGTLIGRVWGGRVPSPAPATVIGANVLQAITFDRTNGALTGTADVLAWNFNGAVLPAGLSVVAYFWWIEN